jgi:hypothetical protein
LIFRNDLHENFLERLAAGFFYDRAANGGLFRRGRGLLRAHRQEGAEYQAGEGE